MRPRSSALLFSAAFAFTATAILVAFTLRQSRSADAHAPTDLAMPFDGDFGSLVPPPTTVEDLFRLPPELIVTGTYGEPTLVWRDEVHKIAAARGMTREEFGPWTLYEFTVDEYVAGTGPGMLQVWQYGDASSGQYWAFDELPTPGVRVTLVLKPREHGGRDAYEPVAYGRLMEKDGVIHIAWMPDTLPEEYRILQPAKGWDMARLHDELRTIARKRGLPVPTAN